MHNLDDKYRIRPEFEPRTFAHFNDALLYRHLRRRRPNIKTVLVQCIVLAMGIFCEQRYQHLRFGRDGYHFLNPVKLLYDFISLSQIVYGRGISD